MVAINERKLLMMVRDRGHALTIEIKKRANLLLEHNFIHFLGSDVHKTDCIYTNIEEIKKQLRKIIKQ